MSKGLSSHGAWPSKGSRISASCFEEHELFQRPSPTTSKTYRSFFIFFYHQNIHFAREKIYWTEFKCIDSEWLKNKYEKKMQNVRWKQDLTRVLNERFPLFRYIQERLRWIERFRKNIRKDNKSQVSLLGLRKNFGPKLFLDFLRLLMRETTSALRSVSRYP